MSDMLEITPSAQVRALRDTSRGSVLRVIIPGSSPNTLSEKLTSSGGREDALQSIIFTFSTHCSRVIPMGEHSRLRRTSEINLFELDTATLIYVLKSALVQSLGKDINKFSLFLAVFLCPG